MGGHDQAALWHTHAGDTHDDIHDGGRTLFTIDEQYGPYDDYGHREKEVPIGTRPAYVFRGEKLIPDTVHVHPGPFSVTKWESLYSSVFGTGTEEYFEFPVSDGRFPVTGGRVEPSFAPIVDESWRVVGHMGWIDGYEICVPTNTIRVGAKLGAILEKRRLGEIRQPFLADADRFARPPFANSPFHAATTSSPSAPKPDNCIPPAKTSLRPTNWDDARRGPLKGESGELRYQSNINYFLKGGGTAVIGRGFARDLLAARKYESFLDLKAPLQDQNEGFWDVPFPRKPYLSGGYRFLVLVGPDGYLQAVLGVQRVHEETSQERTLSIAAGVIDIALTIWMIIDIFTIPVALFRLGVLVAEEAAIQSIRLILDEAAEAALKAAEQEAKRVLVRGAMTGPERAEAKTAWAKLKQEFWDAGKAPPRKQFSEAEAKEWSDKIAKRMSELGIPKKDQGAGLKTIPAKGEKLYPGESGAKRLNMGELGPFNPRGSQRGINYRSAPATKDMYGYQLGVSVHGNVFDPWEGFDLWNNPTTTIGDRIDAIIAHEWSEYNGLTHWETIELIPETKLPISPRARELSRYMMIMAGEPEMVLTEFTKAEWSAIKAAGKQNAPFEEKMAAAAAAKAK